MKITKNIIFSGILLFGLTTILLVLFNIQLFYLRAIFSFIFLTTIPGLLIMLMLKIRKIEFWEYVVYTIGLSIAFLMFAGLAVNWILPWLRITDKPLSLIPLITSFGIILSIFGFVAYKRNKKISLKITLPKLNRINKVFFAVPIIFPILSILGAITLNNGGPNYLTMIMLGGIAVYALLTVFLRDKLNEHIFPFAILNFTLALTLATSLRSWGITGHDIVAEYHVFSLTNNVFQWNMSNLLGNAYNACLSLTILPTILSNFLSISNNEYIFKLIFPIIISFMPIGLYLLLYRYTKPIYAYISVLYFIYFPTFFIDFPMMVRQEFAFYFYIASLLILFDKNISSKLKKILFLIFGFSIIVSHYSTSYIALAVFIITYIFSFSYRLIENRHDRLSKIKSIVKQKFYLSLDTVILLTLFSIFWYSQLTQISGGLNNFISKVISNIENVRVKTNQVPLWDQFNLFFEQNNQTQILNNYAIDTEVKYKNSPVLNFYPQSTYGNYSPELIPEKVLPNKIESNNISSGLIAVIGAIQKLTKLIIIIGILSILFKLFKKKTSEVDTEYIFMIIISTSFLVISFILLPIILVDYSLLRVYQQMLIFLSLPAVFGGIIVFSFFKNENFKIVSISIILIIYFLANSGFIYQIIGGAQASIQLNNYGLYYDKYYYHSTDVASGNWLKKEYDSKDPIYTDGSTAFGLITFSHLDSAYFNSDVLPYSIVKNGYVYANYINVTENKIVQKYKGIVFDVLYPTLFLDENKNLVYSNNYSKIYK